MFRSSIFYHEDRFTAFTTSEERRSRVDQLWAAVGWVPKFHAKIMTPESSTRDQPFPVPKNNYGSIESTGCSQAAQAEKSPQVTVKEGEEQQQHDSQSSSKNDSAHDDATSPTRHALPPPWNDKTNDKSPLNWSPWCKYSIIALVSFIELLTLVFRPQQIMMMMSV